MRRDRRSIRQCALSEQDRKTPFRGDCRPFRLGDLCVDLARANRCEQCVGLGCKALAHERLGLRYVRVCGPRSRSQRRCALIREH